MTSSGRRGGPLRWIVVVTVAGATATLALAIHAGMGLADAGQIGAIAASSALVAGSLGVAATYVLRNHSVGIHATIAAFTAVTAVAVGSVAAAKRMFIAAHDLDTLVVVLAAAVTVGVVIALLLGERVQRASMELQEAARRIGRRDSVTRVDLHNPREFATLARELEMMSTRLDEATARERRLDSSRRELVAWVSHDLRTPLAGIRAMAEALEDGLVSDPESVRRYHATISMETERLGHLVDELFELSVIQAGALRLELERVSLGDLVSDAMAGTLPTAGARRVRVGGRLTDDAPLELWLDPREISRVLRNLLENAIRHTPNDGAVSIEAGVDGDHAYLAVQDECGGIPEAEIGRVFEPSFRGGAARTPNGNGDGAGAGLGLAIARGIIEAHHGRITVRNHTPGCRFEVRLPVLVHP